MRQICVQSASCRTQANAEATLQACKAAGINSISYNTLQGGAHYNSAFFPRCSSIQAGFDPLGFMISRGHELGIKIYDWVCPGALYTSAWDMAGKLGAPATMHWLDFSIPAARQRMADIEADMLSKYSPDGISLDYIRYPNTVPIATWNASGHYLASDITTTVSMIGQVLGRKGKLQAYVFYSDWLKNVLQDWPNWIRNGLLDIAMPMLQAYQNWGGYKTWGPGHLVRYWLDTYTVPENLPVAKIAPTLYFSDYKNDSSGNTIKDIPNMTMQIQDALDDGFKNLVFFDFGKLSTYSTLLKGVNTMPIVNDLTNAANDVETQVTALVANATALTTQAAALTTSAADLNAKAADLTTQVANLRKSITDLGQANVLADQLASIL